MKSNNPVSYKNEETTKTSWKTAKFSGLKYKWIFLLSGLMFLFSCGQQEKQPPEPVRLTLEQANKLAELPLACMQNEYPNKPGHVLGGEEYLKEPHKQHPAFYGCFDWHSSVHGHWSLVKLLKEYPGLEKADTIRLKLRENITKEH
ncbi:MAG: DUF2891 family protein, partial [Bacteroidales bacterium]|nr:DUF2891 family protein [Bacteroidales bacterium]